MSVAMRGRAEEFGRRGGSAGGWTRSNAPRTMWRRLVLILYAVYVWRGQCWSYNPPEYRAFKKMTMEFKHRGSYNISACARELINCWELVKPNIVCLNWYRVVSDSICSALRDRCADESLSYDPYYWYIHEFPMYESLCPK